MSRDLPMHTHATKPRCPSVAIILIQYQCPRQAAFCTPLGRACPNLQLNGTGTADLSKACFLSAGASPVDGCWPIRLLRPQTDGAYSTISWWAQGYCIPLKQWNFTLGGLPLRRSMAVFEDILIATCTCLCVYWGWLLTAI